MASFPTVEFTKQQYTPDYESYDRAVARMMNSLRVVGADGIPTNKPIPLIFATPERSWAEMRKKFQKQIDANRDFRIPLPFLSVQQIGDTTFDPKRYLYNKILYRRVALSDDFKKCLSQPAPQPYNFQYSIELWTKSRYEARVAVMQFANLFEQGGMTYRLVDHGYPFGVKYIPFFLEGITDNTNLEPADQERTLRWTFTLRIEGWLPPIPQEFFVVQEIQTTVETAANLCEENIYEDTLLDVYSPLVHGNAATGEIVEDSQPFTPGYSGPDYRVWRLSPGNPCQQQ